MRQLKSYTIGRSPSLGLSIVAEPELRLTNVLERLHRFDSFHNGLDGDVLTPAARILNPEQGGHRIYHMDDVWLLPYYVGFRVLVLKHERSISGPHACRLLYQSNQTDSLYWIATLQIEDVMFYNEPLVVEKLTTAIRHRQFYIAPKSYADPVAL